MKYTVVEVNRSIRTGKVVMTITAAPIGQPPAYSQLTLNGISATDDGELSFTITDENMMKNFHLGDVVDIQNQMRSK